MTNEDKEEMKMLLNEFADSMLLPAIDQLIDIKLEEKLEEKLETKLEEKFGGFRAEFDGKLASHRYEMKDYMDKKLASHHADIISAIRGDKVRDKDYKTQVVGVLKRNGLVNKDESIALTQLAN
jgi:recombinational DNA repair ATPase RecF